MSLCHRKVAWIPVFLFAWTVMLSIVKIQKLPAPLICSYLYNKEDDSAATQCIVTNALCIHSTPCPFNEKGSWEVSEHLTCVSMLFCVPPAPQEDMAVELPQAGTEDEPLRKVDVSAPLLTGARLRLHFFIFHSVKHSYSNMRICVTTEACKSLAGKVERINLLSTQSWFKRTFK